MVSTLGTYVDMHLPKNESKMEGVVQFVDLRRSNAIVCAAALRSAMSHFKLGEEQDAEAVVILRRAVWAKLFANCKQLQVLKNVDGQRETLLNINCGPAGLGVSLMSASLNGVVDALEHMRSRLQNLRVGFESLDDGKAEAIFRGRGPLGGVGADSAAALATKYSEACKVAIEAARECYSTLGGVSSVLVELPDPEASVAALEAGVRAIEVFSAHVSSLMARCRAATIRANIAFGVWNNIKGSAAQTPHMTEGTLCKDVTVQEVITDHTGVAQIDTLRRKIGSWGRICGEFFERANQKRVPNRSGLSANYEKASQRLCETALPQTFVCTTERLLQNLRWARRCPSACEVEVVLNGIFTAFDDLSADIARLYEELVCLGDVHCPLSPLAGRQGSLPELLLAAAKLQQDALAWKCRIVVTPNDMSLEGSAANAPQLQIREFASFLEQALAVWQRLAPIVISLQKQRNAAVDLLKGSTEAAACTDSVVRSKFTAEFNSDQMCVTPTVVNV